MDKRNNVAMRGQRRKNGRKRKNESKKNLRSE